MGLGQDEAMHRKERTGKIDSKKTVCVCVRWDMERLLHAGHYALIAVHV